MTILQIGIEKKSATQIYLYSVKILIFNVLFDH